MASIDELTNAQIEKLKRIHTWKTLHKKIGDVWQSEKDLSPMTKAEIVEFGASIGVNLSMSLSKSVMIESLKGTPEFALSEAKRKAFDPLD
jgi:hypothetical protein